MAKTKSVDPAELIKQLKRDRAEAIKRAEAEFRAARKKALASVVQPKKEEIAALKKRIKDDTNELVTKQSELAKLLGKKVKAQKVGSLGARVRVPFEDKLDYAFKIYDHLEGNKKKSFARKDLLPLIEGAPPALTVAKLVEVWNGENKRKKIKVVNGGAPNKNRYQVA